MKLEAAARVNRSGRRLASAHGCGAPSSLAAYSTFTDTHVLLDKRTAAGGFERSTFACLATSGPSSAALQPLISAMMSSSEPDSDLPTPLERTSIWRVTGSGLDRVALRKALGDRFAQRSAQPWEKLS
jgi:hypothetical protein